MKLIPYFLATFFKKQIFVLILKNITGHLTNIKQCWMESYNLSQNLMSN